ncbi:Helix-turn-helix domain [Chryseobacterium balustinum]|uniref:Helix-turn-helix domain n=2 Tax=Chryseobacterium TaxID=59732 RepID=A0AAX2ISE2_9FLAO|nr:Helix-turn-helix domain [Chryseobacterium balustinum]
MSIFSENIRFLRDKMKASQQKVGDEISITRGRYATYEDGRSEPPIELLVKLSKYYKVSIDLLLTVDLRKYPLDDVVNLPNNRILLPMKVDHTGENRIEIVPQKASMGYLSGYNDPEFVEGLQHLSLPF